MRVIAEHTQAVGRLPTPGEIEEFLSTGFYLPFANKPAHKEMREKARKLVSTSVNEHQDELLRTWATERPFELYLAGVVISGRADVIYDDVDGTPENLVIVDYKTSTRDDVQPLNSRSTPTPAAARGSPYRALSSKTWQRRSGTMCP